MFPKAYIDSFWQPDLRPQVFVAMSFDKKYEERFSQVFAPAIRSVSVGGEGLEPLRVDYRRRGEDILTEIVDGIIHSQLFLADVSVAQEDPQKRGRFRNGNVMYEIGVAVACRQPSEVILVREDDEATLFDASTIPHEQMDFRQPEASIMRLAATMVSRLNERALLRDARVEKALRELGPADIHILETMFALEEHEVWLGRNAEGNMPLPWQIALPRLLDRGLVHLSAYASGGVPGYRLTTMGTVAAGHTVQVRKRIAEMAPADDDGDAQTPPANDNDRAGT